MSISQSTPFPLRMPEELREQIQALAKANNRSLNTEIVLLLQQALGGHATKTASLAIDVQGAEVKTLAEEIAEIVAAKLRASST
jgi:hypothetical protein